MKLSKRIWITISVLAILTLWLGVPAFNKWRADKVVDELCAKDGGIKVYETVTLPKERFNQWGQFEVRNKDYMKSGDEYFYISETTFIKGSPVKRDYGDLDIIKMQSEIYRKSDNHMLGTKIIYARRGGDPVGPWHPSSYSCNNNESIENLIFKKPTN